MVPISKIKDKTKFDHKHDLVYYVECPKCQEDYIGEIGRRLHERICDHSGKYGKSHMLNIPWKITINTFLLKISKLLGYPNSKFKRKISEALSIKELHPSLKKHMLFYFCVMTNLEWHFTYIYLLLCTNALIIVAS